MKMIRTFHPVGQGAFYSEEFFDSEGNCVFRVVYDCGSLKFCGLQRNSDGTRLERKDIEGRVKRASPDGHGVDILFVSHLDDDHVNLIPCLMPFQNHQIRRVILPLLSAEERYVLTGYHLSRSRRGRISDALNGIINSPEEYFGNDTKVTFVRPADRERSPMGNEVDDEGVGVDDLQKEVPSLTKISIGNYLPDNGRVLRWLLIPYNHKPQRYSNLIDALENVFGKGFQIANLKDPDFVIRNLQVLRRCYKALPDRINRNSMALYSGPHDGACPPSTGEVTSRDFWGSCCPDQLKDYCFDCGLRRVKPFPVGVYPIFFCRPGCLYTGDLLLDDADLTRAFERYVRNIGMVQLPHHGSLDSFGNGDLPIERRVCVVTYGEKNQFGHPAFAVKRAVAQKGGLWVDVTETDESRFKVEYTV